MFNPATINYKEYMREQYNLLESPDRLYKTEFTRNQLDVNALESALVVKNDKYIGNYNYGSFKLNMFIGNEDNIIFYNLLQEDNNYIYLHHSFKELKLNDKNGIESLDIWNFRSTRGLARFWIFDYILNNYDFIMSDKLHTPKGEEFWKNLIKEALDKIYKCGAINLKTKEFIEINNTQDINQFYTDKKQFRLIIYKK